MKTAYSMKTLPTKENGFLKELTKNRALFIMALPAVIFVFINNYLPMAGLIMAFKNINFAKGIFGSPWCGLDNFKFLFLSPDAWLITRNTVGYNLIFIILGLIIPVFFAICLNEIKNKYLAKTYQSVMLLPYFLSYVIVSYLVYAFFSEQGGFLNKSILPALGLNEISWYSDPRFWPFILVVTYVWKTTGYATVVYLAAITGIDPEYYEAAVIDGASKLRQVWHITIPSLKPLMIILTLMAIGRVFNSDFGLFYQVPLNSQLVYNTTQTIDVYVYKAVSTEAGLGAAAGFYQSALGFILVLLSNWFLGKIDPENKPF